MKIDYPIIAVKHAQTQEKSLGWLIGDCLVVMRGPKNSWELWNKYGTTIFRNIETQEDAFELALWINDIYSSYFTLWKEYPELDLFSMTMWTVQEGLKTYETIEKMRTLPKISLRLVNSIYNQSTGKKYYWNYMKECRT